MTDVEIKNLLNKAKICNRLQEIPILDKVETYYDNYVNECTHIVIIDMNAREKLVYIPRGVKTVRTKNIFANVRPAIKVPMYTKKLKIVGGEDLEDIEVLINLFTDTEYQSGKTPHEKIVHGNMHRSNFSLYRWESLDLSEMHISKVINANGFLMGVSAREIILPNEIPEMLQDIRNMFATVTTDHIIGIERIGKSKFASGMYCDDVFRYSRIINLDLSKFNVYGFGYGDMKGASIDVLKLDKNIVSKENADLLLKQCRIRFGLTIERIELV